METKRTINRTYLETYHPGLLVELERQRFPLPLVSLVADYADEVLYDSETPADFYKLRLSWPEAQRICQEGLIVRDLEDGGFRYDCALESYFPDPLCVGDVIQILVAVDMDPEDMDQVVCWLGQKGLGLYADYLFVAPNQRLIRGPNTTTSTIVPMCIARHFRDVTIKYASLVAEVVEGMCVRHDDEVIAALFRRGAPSGKKRWTCFPSKWKFAVDGRILYIAFGDAASQPWYAFDSHTATAKTILTFYHKSKRDPRFHLEVKVKWTSHPGLTFRGSYHEYKELHARINPPELQSFRKATHPWYRFEYGNGHQSGTSRDSLDIVKKFLFNLPRSKEAHLKAWLEEMFQKQGGDEGTYAFTYVKHEQQRPLDFKCGDTPWWYQ